MTSLKKAKRLERVTIIAKNNENIQINNWKKAKNELEAATDRLNQLEKYFNNYASASDDSVINAKLYSNKQHILDLVREAVLYQRNEIKRLQENESFELSVLKTRKQEKMINEKIAESKMNDHLMKKKKEESNDSEEMCLQFFSRFNSKQEK